MDSNEYAVTNLDVLFPECESHAVRQGIKMFGCCSFPDREPCDQVRICKFANGQIQKKVLKKNTKIFVGWLREDNMNYGFAVVWFVSLPIVTMAKKSIENMEKFLGSLKVSNRR